MLARTGQVLIVRIFSIESKADGTRQRSASSKENSTRVCFLQFSEENGVYSLPKTQWFPNLISHLHFYVR